MDLETCPTLQKCLLQKNGLHGPFVPELSLSCLRVLEVAGGGVEVAGGWLGTGMLEQVASGCGTVERGCAPFWCMARSICSAFPATHLVSIDMEPISDSEVPVKSIHAAPHAGACPSVQRHDSGGGERGLQKNSVGAGAPLGRSCA